MATQINKKRKVGSCEPWRALFLSPLTTLLFRSSAPTACSRPSSTSSSCASWPRMGASPPPFGVHPADRPFPCSSSSSLLSLLLSLCSYSGVEVRVTPTRTEIIILATRTQNVLGEKGRRIRELTAKVQKRFGFPDDSLELFAEKVGTTRMLLCRRHASCLSLSLPTTSTSFLFFFSWSLSFPSRSRRLFPSRPTR